MKDFSVDEALALAAKFEQENRSADAERVLRDILAADRQQPEALNRLGAIVFSYDIFQALYLFDRAVNAKKRYGAALANRGAARGQLGDFDEALRDLTLATHLEPKNPIAWNNLGHTLERMNRPGEAMEALQRCLELDPHHAVSHLSRGTILARLGRHEAAIRAFTDAIAGGGQVEGDAHYNRAISRLAMGDMGAFGEYEWRFRSTENIYRAITEAPIWKGEPLDGKTILLWAEQGMGDAIQFMRYVDEVRVHLTPVFSEASTAPERKILLYVHTALRELCRSHWGDLVTVLDSDKDLPPHDFHSPLMSLPIIFHDIPPPWSPREQSFGCRDCDRWGGMIGDNMRQEINAIPGVKQMPAPVLRVGLCWAGNPAHRNDRNRSMAFKTLESIIGMPGVRFYSLQLNVSAADRDVVQPLPDGLIPERFVVDLTPHLTDMRQTAHAIGWLDLVITVDTAVAHISASLGTRTWVLVPAVADWRWGQHGMKTPWYPDATVFRQKRAGDWAPVIDDIRRLLADEVHTAS